MFPIIPAKHPLRSSFHVTLLIRRSHWLLVHSDPLFPSSFLDSLPFRLFLSPSIFTHWTSSDTAFHFSFILPFSQKCRGERPLVWGCSSSARQWEHGLAALVANPSSSSLWPGLSSPTCCLRSSMCRCCSFPYALLRACCFLA